MIINTVLFLNIAIYNSLICTWCLRKKTPPVDSRENYFKKSHWSSMDDWNIWIQNSEQCQHLTWCPPRWVPLSNYFKKPCHFAPPSTFWNFVFPTFLLIPPPKCKKVLFPSETFKLLLLRCQYGHTVVRRNTH